MKLGIIGSGCAKLSYEGFSAILKSLVDINHIDSIIYDSTTSEFAKQFSDLFSISSGLGSELMVVRNSNLIIVFPGSFKDPVWSLVTRAKQLNKQVKIV